MLILFVTSFCFPLKLKLEYIAEGGLKSVRYLMGTFHFWAQDFFFNSFFSLWIIRVEGFFLFCSVIRGTAFSENVPLQIPSLHRN